MTEQNVSLLELETAREQLVAIINSSLTQQERKFLLSFKNRNPDWSLLGLSGIENLPAVRWKLHNLEKMNLEKHAQAYARLLKTLGAHE